MARSLSILLLLAAFFALDAPGAEVMPPPPQRHFNDYARVVSPATAQTLDQTLAEFERATSSQIVVAVFPKMQSDSSVEDYTVRVAQSWKVGQAGKNNGAVLFVFVEDRQLYIQTGYGLEGALPDALAKQIIENEIKPQFRAGNFDAGLTAGVTAILQATRGEYKGTGRTAREQQRPGPQVWHIVLFIILFAAISSLSRRSGGTVYRRRGRSHWGGPWGGMGGGGWSGGGGRSGGFSGGGGSFGGGGAGGRW